MKPEPISDETLEQLIEQCLHDARVHRRNHYQLGAVHNSRVAQALAELQQARDDIKRLRRMHDTLCETIVDQKLGLTVETTMADDAQAHLDKLHRIRKEIFEIVSGESSDGSLLEEVTAPTDKRGPHRPTYPKEPRTRPPDTYTDKPSVLSPETPAPKVEE